MVIMITILLLQYHAVSPERAYAVDVQSGDLLLTGEDTTIVVNWSPGSIISSQLAPNPADITVDIKLFRQGLKPSSLNQYQWIQEDVLGEGLPNSGEATVLIPPINVSCHYPIAYDDIDFSVCPVALKVTVNSLPDSTEEKVSEFITKASVGQWSGVAFLKADDTSDMKLRETCERWSNADSHSTRLSQLRACPPTVRLARFDPAYQQVQLASSFARLSNRYHEDLMSLFHPGSHTCFIN